MKVILCDDTNALHVAEMHAMPRQGETVYLTFETTHKEQFVVKEVAWQVDTDTPSRANVPIVILTPAERN